MTDKRSGSGSSPRTQGRVVLPEIETVTVTERFAAAPRCYVARVALKPHVIVSASMQPIRGGPARAKGSSLQQIGSVEDVCCGRGGGESECSCLCN